MGRLSGHPKQALTDIKVRKLKIPGRYVDGDGLHLIVSDTLAKKWVLRTMIRGRRRDMGLGSYSYVSLEEAREKARHYRKMAKEGLDPIAERKRETGVPTFSEAVVTVYHANRPTWRNEKHSAQWINTLNTYAMPQLGNRQINEITSGDILDVLLPIWTEKPETARRVKQRLSTVFDWAKAKGFIEGENPVAGVTRGLPAAQPLYFLERQMTDHFPTWP